MSSIKSYILLTRPVNLIIAYLSIFVGGFVTGTVHPLHKLLLACLSGTLIAAGANAINDVFDLDIDRVNKPKRPLPSGLLSVGSARIFSFILFITGCLTALFIHWQGFMVALLSSIWLYLYSLKLKRTVLWGNFSVGFISGLAFIYGGLAVGRWIEALIVGIFALFYHFAREIIKDMEDMEGDRSDGVITLPIKHGIRTAQVWATAIILLLVLLTLIPYKMGLFNDRYFYIVLFGVDLILAGVVISMWMKPNPGNWGMLSVIMKADMLVGLIAVYLGS